MATEPTHPYVILDVFTDTPLQGNPLAVFTNGEEIPSRLMQATARELNLSETVFLLPGDEDCDAHARIFTPYVELPFAGHPVLGAAFVVGADKPLEVIRLRCGAGLVPVRVRRDDDGQIVAGGMEQPLPKVEPFPEVDALLAALGIDAAALPVEVYDNGMRHVMVMLDDLAQVSALNPDLRALRKLGEYGFSCFARVDAGIRTRMFGPGLGVDEDPATGSAAGPLAVHLVRHGLHGFSSNLEIDQGVEMGRPSHLRARVEGSPDQIERVIVAGSAVVVAQGHFRLSG
ncbi:MAG TPA: PhzF family phenazine biosynthesis protein [Solirubrobacteraceae bacterium]|jgi:trans-2,3-dihydro-3-hydroxyanthranilate isomerase|nr:PhzF family phenazine biosynthesis protein [Solirubrobacteraceae bacterium]